MDTTILQICTLIIAVVGAALGVLNTWRAFGQDRLRLRVEPAHAYMTNGARQMCITVVNLSTFPVTLTNFGFTLVGDLNHMAIASPVFTQNERLPIRLEPRASCTALVDIWALQDAQIARIHKAYVSTACGHRVLGDSGALHEIVLQARAGSV